jgi:hypothetical protein
MTSLQSTPPWLSWFSNLNSPEAIREAAYQGAVSICDLQTLKPDEACRQLDAAWRDIFVAGDQHVAILDAMVGRAVAFSKLKYPTLRDFNIYRSSSAVPPSEVHTIWCLTGLAGVSKTSLAKAFERICQLKNGGVLTCETQRQIVRPVRRISINAQQSVQGVLEMLANPAALATLRSSTTRALTTHAREWLAASASSCLLVDEMQFFTQSATASTKTSHLVMTLASLDLPLIYTANYSLVNKLMQRPHEERNRLLANPIVLSPLSADDKCWTDSVAEYFKVAPECFRLDGPDEILELHRLTAGLFRALRELLVQSYREATNLGRTVVTIAEVRRAYRSRAFSANRKDVEDLTSLSVSRALEGQRPDLVCPFVERIAGIQPVDTSRANMADASSFDLSAAIIESSASATAQSTLKTIRESADDAALRNGPAKVLRMPRPGPVSAQSLLDGAALFRQSIRSGRSVRKKVDPVESSSKGGDENAN